MCINGFGACVRRAFETSLSTPTKIIYCFPLPLFFVYIKIIISAQQAKCKQKTCTSVRIAQLPRVTGCKRHRIELLQVLNTFYVVRPDFNYTRNSIIVSVC